MRFIHGVPSINLSSLSPFPRKVQPATSVPRTVIRPIKGWSALQLGELWDYRDLLYFLVYRDILGRYRQTALGPIWIVLQPIVSMLLYTLVFGFIARLPSDGVPYTVFSYVGLLPWTFFSDAVGIGVGSLSGSTHLISKVYFPRLLVPISRLLAGLVDLFISFGILVVMMIYYGLRPNAAIVLIPFLLLVAAATGLGFGMIFSGLVVKYRDFGNVVGYAVRAWMYASPVVYSITLIPEQWRFLYELNPITGVVNGFRWALLDGPPPNFLALALSVIIAVALLFAGVFVFKRVERNIVDIV